MFKYIQGGLTMVSSLQSLVQGNVQQNQSPQSLVQNSNNTSNPTNYSNNQNSSMQNLVQGSSQPTGIVAPNSPGSVNIGGTSYDMNYLNNPNNQSAVQTLLANNKGGVQTTGYGNATNNTQSTTPLTSSTPTMTPGANIVTPETIGTPKTVNIGGATFDWNYANDPNNQEQIRQAIVDGGNNVSVKDVNGNTYDNITGTQIGSSATVKDNSSLIGQQFDSQLASAQAALKASIAESMAGYNKTIADAPGQYQPLRDQASYAGAQNGQNLNEMLANNGQQGGVNRTEQTQVNSATENNINTLNTAQQKVISDANASISGLQAKGDMQGAQLIADNANAKMAALIAESNRVEGQTYSRGQDATKNAQIDAAAAYTKSQDTINNTGKLADGTLTMAGKTNSAQLAASTASTAYQTLINLNYPKEEAIKMSQAIASYNGTNLDNNAKSIANKYAPLIAQGAIDGGKLTNGYQALVNAGYSASQAADIALKYAQVGSTNATANATNVSSYASAGSFSGGGTISGGVPPALSGWITDAANKNGIPPSILAGLFSVESGFNTNAVNKSSGATGIGQFLPSTARSVGLKNMTDPQSSIYASAAYLAQRIKQAGSLNGGIMGYGEGTTAYLNKVLGAAKGITVATASASKNNSSISTKQYSTELAAAKSALSTAVDSGTGAAWITAHTKDLKALSYAAYASVYDSYYTTSGKPSAMALLDSHNKILADNAAHHDSQP